MFPILNKYVTSELKNSKYCPANFLNSDEPAGDVNKNKTKAGGQKANHHTGRKTDGSSNYKFSDGNKIKQSDRK